MSFRWIALLLTIPAALACDCAPGTICERVQASVIFFGDVIEGGTKPGEDPWKNTSPFARIRIKETYRGLSSDTNEVQVNLMFIPGMCSASPYRLGEQIVVMTERDNDGSVRDGGCTRSFRPANYPGALDYIRRYFSGQTTTVIRGRVRTYRMSTPIAGVHIRALGTDKEFSTTSLADGSFEIASVPAGFYQLRANAEGYFESASTRRIAVAARNCAEVSLELTAKTLVEGIVLDPDHRPIPNLDVFMKDPEGKREYGEQVRTDSSGRFRFSNIDPANYQLYVSPHGVSPKSPMEKTIYPKPITVTPNAGISNIEFVVPRPQPVRRIHIDLVWPSGQPVTNATVYCPESGSRDGISAKTPSGYTSDNGRASCLVLAGRPYQVLLKYMGFRPRLTLTQPIDHLVPPGTNDVHLRFQLNQADYEAYSRLPR